jgi:hypothetical protein
MADDQEELDNTRRLMAQLNANKTDQNTIMTFVPEDLKEEEIIDNLNFIASNEGLSVVNLSLKPAPLVSLMDTGTVNESGQQILNNTVAQNAAPKPKNYDVSFSVTGNYEKIKNVFEKIYRLGRYNVVGSLEIKKQEEKDASGKKSGPTNNLIANAQLKFNVLRKGEQPVSIDNPAFAKASFDLSSAQAIRDKKSVEILKMNIDQAGRTNPFLP